MREETTHTQKKTIQYFNSALFKQLKRVANFTWTNNWQRCRDKGVGRRLGGGWEGGGGGATSIKASTMGKQPAGHGPPGRKCHGMTSRDPMAQKERNNPGDEWWHLWCSANGQLKSDMKEGGGREPDRKILCAPVSHSDEPIGASFPFRDTVTSVPIGPLLPTWQVG